MRDSRTALWSKQLTGEAELLSVHSHIRALAGHLGLSEIDSMRFATAVSEVSRSALLVAVNVEVRLLVDADAAELSCEIEHNKVEDEGRAELASVHQDADSLVDSFELRETIDGAIVASIGIRLTEVGAFSAGPLEVVDELEIDPNHARRAQRSDLVAALHRARRSEDALRSHTRRLDLAIDTAGLGIIEYTRGHFSCNLHACELLGVGEGALHMPRVEKALRDFDSEILRTFWNESFRGEAEGIIEWQAGHRWLQAKAATIGPDSRLLVLFDISDRISRERDLSEQVEIEEQLIGIVSHDLKNPLSTVSLALDSIEVAAVPEQARPIELGRKALTRAERIIFELLDYTRMRLTKRFPIERRDADLGSLAKQIVEATRMREGESRLQLHKRGNTRGNWDPARLEQVLTNLVDNAVAYSHADAAVVVEVDGSDPETVELHVSNQGKPIAPELLPVLFSPFTRGSNRVTKRSLGLGMHIVKLVVEAHSGQVSVTSSAEEGTRVSARLPRDRERNGGVTGC